LIEKSNSAAVKQAYSEATNEAIQSGAFGVPWIVANVDGKEYKLFGTDRLHILFNICNVPFKGPLEMAKL
jgi:2-hydroxychromene-2-carboxylate isomerase